MTKKLTLTLVAILVAGLALFAWRGGWFGKSNGDAISIGVLVPLTGGAATYGQNSRRGAELALQEFSAANPNVKVRLQVEDSRGEPAVGVSAAQKLIEVD